MRATEKTSKKNVAGKIFVISRNELFFFSEYFFYLPKLTVFFGNRQQSNARAGQKETHVFFGNGRSKYITRAHLNREKNIVALPAMFSPSNLIQ